MFTGGDIVTLIVAVLTLVGVVYSARKTGHVERKTDRVADQVGQTNGNGTIAAMLEDSIADRVEIKNALAAYQETVGATLTRIEQVQQRHDQRDEITFKALFEHLELDRPDLPDLNS